MMVLRMMVFVLLKSWNFVFPRMAFRIPRMEFQIPRAAPRIPRNSPRAPRMAFSLREHFSCGPQASEILSLQVSRYEKYRCWASKLNNQKWPRSLYWPVHAPSQKECSGPGCAHPGPAWAHDGPHLGTWTGPKHSKTKHMANLDGTSSDPRWDLDGPRIGPRLSLDSTPRRRQQTSITRRKTS